MGDGLREQGVARQRIRFGFFTGVHIGLARVSGRIDEEAGLSFAQKFQQEIITRVIQFLANERDEGLMALAQSLGERLANVTAAAEENNHDGVLPSRLASEMTPSRYARYSQLGNRPASACSCASGRNPCRNAASSGQPIL